MSMDYIRSYYDVPAKRGIFVLIATPNGSSRIGKIVGSRGAYLRVKIDNTIGTYHPTDLVQYFTCSECAKQETCNFAFDQYNTNCDCLAEK